MEWVVGHGKMTRVDRPHQILLPNSEVVTPNSGPTIENYLHPEVYESRVVDYIIFAKGKGNI